MWRIASRVQIISISVLSNKRGQPATTFSFGYSGMISDLASLNPFRDNPRPPLPLPFPNLSHICCCCCCCCYCFQSFPWRFLKHGWLRTISLPFGIWVCMNIMVACSSAENRKAGFRCVGVTKLLVPSDWRIFWARWFVGNSDKKASDPLRMQHVKITWTEHETQITQNNNIVWLSNMADMFWREVHVVAKVCGLFFSWLCFSDADWLGRQSPIMWLLCTWVSHVHHFSSRDEFWHSQCCIYAH